MPRKRHDEPNRAPKLSSQQISDSEVTPTKPHGPPTDSEPERLTRKVRATRRPRGDCGPTSSLPVPQRARVATAAPDDPVRPRRGATGVNEGSSACACASIYWLRLTDRTVAASADGRSSPSAAQWFGKTTSPATAGPRFAGHARAMRSKCLEVQRPCVPARSLPHLPPYGAGARCNGSKPAASSWPSPLTQSQNTRSTVSND